MESNNIPLFKIHASSCGKIMTNDRSGKNMGQTAKSYCEEWLKSKLYDRKKEFTSKYTSKGNECEFEALQLISQYFNYDNADKNDEYFENDFAKGVPDYIRDCVIDNKSSWDCFTFPLFDTEIPNKDYEYQGQVYMWLTGKDKFKLVYTLMDAPEFIVKQQAIYFCRNNNIQIDPEIFDKFTAVMTYSNLPIEKRIKVFEVERNEETIKAIELRVLQCREYINELLTKLNK